MNINKILVIFSVIALSYSGFIFVKNNTAKKNSEISLAKPMLSVTKESDQKDVSSLSSTVLDSSNLVITENVTKEVTATPPHKEKIPKTSEQTLAEKVKQRTSFGRKEVVTLAGGCFWCIESALQETPGVIDAVSGYSGGVEKKAHYLDVVKGTTKHRESVQVTFDPDLISLDELLGQFWSAIDPTDDGGQFADRGFQYTTAIFYNNVSQKKIIEESKKRLEDSSLFAEPVATKVIPFDSFYPAEEYHQDYYKKSSEHYKRYEQGSGRKGFVQEEWAKAAAIDFLSAAKEASIVPSKVDDVEPLVPKRADYQYSEEEIKLLQKQLPEDVYRIVAEDGTERPYENEYWDNKKEGIYVDVVTGEPLFSSTHKYDSKTGWPSFWQPIDGDRLVEHVDTKLLHKRTEVRSRGGHLGHVFTDGPKDKTGLRYCLNSASLRFIPKEDMQKESYGDYLYLFTS